MNVRGIRKILIVFLVALTFLCFDSPIPAGESYSSIELPFVRKILEAKVTVRQDVSTNYGRIKDTSEAGVEAEKTTSFQVLSWAQSWLNARYYQSSYLNLLNVCAKIIN